VDNKQWDNLADCYVEDVVFESPQLGKMEGRYFIVRVFKKSVEKY
jgi:hypothetical protein